jgi:copper chaperone CopZ
VEVDFRTQTATVSYDPATFQPEQGLQKLAEANYDQSTIRK